MNEINITKEQVDSLLETALPKNYYGLPVIVFEGEHYAVARSIGEAMPAYRKQLEMNLWYVGDENLKEGTGVEDLSSIEKYSDDELRNAIEKHYGFEKFLDWLMEQPFLYFDEHAIKTEYGYLLYPLGAGDCLDYSNID